MANDPDLVARIRGHGGSVMHDVVTLLDIHLVRALRSLESSTEEQFRKVQGQVVALRSLRQDLTGSKGIEETSGIAGDHNGTS